MFSRNKIKRIPENRNVAAFRSRLITLLSLFMLLGMYSGVQAADPANGKALFKDYCARCHSTKMEKDLTGPGLMGVSDRIPEGDWKYQWVKNSALLIESGDKYANEIFKEWNSPMDAQLLDNAQIDDIFSYIDAYAPAAAVGATGQTGAIEPDESLTSMWNWIRFLIFVIVLILIGIAAQIARLRGIKPLDGVNFEKFNGRMMLVFLAFLTAMFIVCSLVFKDKLMYSNSASEHGVWIDSLFWVTMAINIIVFFGTNTLLFYFSYKYRADENREAYFFPENHKLEMLWTVVPAVVLTGLVIFGIKVWGDTMYPLAEPEPDTITIELSAQQFGWQIRYSGLDGEFGDINVHRITGKNILGIDFSEAKSHDDFLSNDLIIPKGRMVDLKIRSRDVLHGVYLPHFRVKMDAVPGMDTRFRFRPIITTDSMRTIKDWPEFDYELACTELCGRGHFSMRKKVVVIEADSFDTWFSKMANDKGARLYSAEVNGSQEEKGLMGTSPELTALKDSE